MSSSTFPVTLRKHRLRDEDPVVYKMVKDINMFPDEYDTTEDMTVTPTTPAAPPTDPPAASIPSHAESPEGILPASEGRIQDGTDVDMFSDNGPSIVPVVSVTEEDISMEGK
jgi:hypothetical protein